MFLTLRKKEMIYKFQVHISNKDLYPQETLDVINILSDIPRDIFFRLFLLYRNTYLNKDIREILNNIKQYGYWSFKKEINKKLSAYHKQQKPYHPSIESDRNILLCEVSMLELLRRELSVSPTNNNMSDLDYHARFIKAILLVNDEIFDIEDLRESDITTENVRIERMLLTNNFSFYPLTGLRDNDLGLMEIIKLLEFCRFCETNNQFNGYLSQYMQQENIKSAQHYGFKYLAIYFAFKKSGAYSCPTLINDYQPFNKIQINNIVPLNQNLDYKKFRQVPLIEIKPDMYLLSDMKFILQRMYTGLIFDLIGVSRLSAQQFFGNFDKLFSEEYLFYKFMENAFKSMHKAVKLNGNQLKQLCPDLDGEPDYYIRIKNTIFIIEHKDVRIAAKDRMARNYDIIEKALFKKFVEVEQKNRKKSKLGVSQLAVNVDKILSGNFKYDKNIKHKRIHIYPILIIFDGLFNLHGLNTLLNREFKSRVKGNKHKVNDLTIMDINTLIKFAPKIANGALDFKSTIDKYHKYIKSKGRIMYHGMSIDNIFERFISYPDFMDGTYKRANMVKFIDTYKKQFKEVIFPQD